jgi:serine protease Do
MQGVELPQRLQQKLKLESPSGLLVIHVEADGPGGNAGVMLGDVIVRIQGRPVSDLSVVQDALRGLRSGERTKLEVIRAGEARELNVTMGERPLRKQS